jgi:hypothetical protein
MYSDYSNLLKTGKKSKLGTISSQIYQAERDSLSKEKDQRLFNARYALLSLLSDEERLEVMNNFCQHCGKGLEDGKKCYCSPGFDK